MKLKVKDKTTISNWHKLYLKYGPKDLLPKPKGRKPMSSSAEYINSGLNSHDQYVLYKQLRIKEQYFNYINDSETKATANNAFYFIEAAKKYNGNFKSLRYSSFILLLP